MPRYAAERTLPAPAQQVWAVLADPDRLPEWWPGVARVVPTVRRALAPGALWQVEGPTRSRMFGRPGLAGGLLVLEAVPERRLAFQLTAEHVDVELVLEPREEGTAVTLACDASRFGGIRRAALSQALSRLAALVRTPVE